MWISEKWISSDTLIPAYYTAMSCESTTNQIQPLKVEVKKTALLFENSYEFF